MLNDGIEMARLRRLLRKRLPSAADFDAFCQDHFQEIHRRFGRGMDRVEKESLLLLLAPSPQAILRALNNGVSEEASLAAPSVRIEAKRGAVAGRSGVFRAGILVVSALAVLGLVAIGLWRARAPFAPACGALMVDDVFLIKQPTEAADLQLALDVRLRHAGQPEGPINLTRASLLWIDRQPERSPYPISASYDLLVGGNPGASRLAQKLSIGELDRVVLRLGYTQETAGYQYTVKLQLKYNGACMVETEPIVLDQEAARWPVAVPSLGRPPTR